MKICSKCNKQKKLKDFYSAPQCELGVRPECRACSMSDRTKRQKKQKTANPDARQAVVIRNRFGLEWNAYQLMLKDQGNACAICKRTDPGFKKRYFSVDHSHTSGRIRGLLCHSCNAGLGMFKDDLELLANAITYLQEQF